MTHDPLRPSAPRRAAWLLLATAASIGVLGPASAAAPTLSTRSAPSPSGTSMPSTAPSGAATPPSGPGAALYGQNCASCHGDRGGGTAYGPALTEVGPADVDFQLSTGRMPLRQERYSDVHRDPAFAPDEIAALVQYVASFPPGGGPTVPVVRPGDPRTGRELYLTYCSACHLAAGIGATLTNGRFAPVADAGDTDPGRRGRPGRSRPHARIPSGVLSDADVDALAAYVDVLQSGPAELDRGGWSLGRLGPFTEGAVAWVLGLGALVLLARRLGSRAR
ncbi:c-type cytochrome [Luedemannella flava]